VLIGDTRIEPREGDVGDAIPAIGLLQGEQIFSSPEHASAPAPPFR
jgi:hypothetical protein